MYFNIVVVKSLCEFINNIFEYMLFYNLYGNLMIVYCSDNKEQIAFF